MPATPRSGFAQSRPFEIASLVSTLAALVALTAGATSIEPILAGLFGCEWVARCISNRRYWRSAWSALDILTIAPGLISLIAPGAWGGLQSLRVLRLLRIARLFHSSAITRTLAMFGSELRAARTQIAVTCAAFGLITYVAAMLAYYAENAAQPDTFGSMADAFWWAVVTLTTVGYGDMYAVTPIGRAVSIGAMFLGIGMFGAIAGIMASVMSNTAERIREERAAAKRSSQGR